MRLSSVHVLVHVLVLGSFSSAARANGVTSHAHMSDLAVLGLPPGELRDFLESPDVRQALRSGSVFPDSGYSIGHDYGEIAHWEPFTNAYLEWIVAEHPPPWTSVEDRQRVAFLLGAMSHGMADQVFDSLFMHQVEQYDGTTEEFDRRTDVFLIIEHDPGIAPLSIFVPSDELDDVLLSSSGVTALPSDFENGMSRIDTALRAEMLLADDEYDADYLALPWAGVHYYAGTTVGGTLPHIAHVIAAYWQVVWERLHGTDSLDRSLVATWPEEGAVNFETTAGRAECRTMLVFGHAIDSASFGGSFHLRPTAGGPDVAAHARFQWSDIANAVLVIPDADLAYDTEYVVELTTDLRTMDGRNLPAPVTLGFRTRCAPDRLADCPPLPEAWVPPTMPPPHPDAGMRDAGPRPDAPRLDGGTPEAPPAASCACRASRGSAAPMLASIPLAVLVRRRRQSR